MSEFRHPHPFENIANAIQDALDPNKPDTLGSAINLVNENARAVEDAIDGGTTRGAFLTEAYSLASTVHGTATWVIPSRQASIFSGHVTAIATGLTAGQTLFLTVNGTQYTVLSDGSGDDGVTAGITAAVFAGDASLAIETWWEAGAGNIPISLAGSGVYVAS